MNGQWVKGRRQKRQGAEWTAAYFAPGAAVTCPLLSSRCMEKEKAQPLVLCITPLIFLTHDFGVREEAQKMPLLSSSGWVS